MSWRMRIAWLIGVGVVYSVRHYPLNWSTFERQRTAGDQKVFNRFRHCITAVREQPVPTHADAQARTDPIKDERRNHRRPAPEEQSGDGRKMGNNEKDRCAPVNGISLRRCGYSVVLTNHPTSVTFMCNVRLCVYLNTEP